MRTRKPRIALFGVGILGGGNLGEGTPVLTDLFESLSRDYEIVYYAFARVKYTHIPKSIRVRQITSWILPGRLKYLFLTITALVDHLFSCYSLIFSVSVYPSGFFAIFLGKIIRRPVLIQLIASEAARLDDISVGNLVRPWLRRVTKYVCDEADILVMVSAYQKELAMNSLPTSRNTEVLPLRIEPKKFIHRKRKLSYPVQFIQVAFYSLLKDQDTMFKAFSQVAEKIDCRLTVIGDGFESSKVRDLLLHLNIADKVNCVGFISQNEIANYYDNAHILLHTARFETGCAVIQEAMASGVAVCGTRVGILSDIGDEYAVIISPGEVDQLANRILELINDSEAYEKLTTHAYQWIRTYDAEWSYQNYKALLKKVIEEY